jgi:hypothetical protein
MNPVQEDVKDILLAVQSLALNWETADNSVWGLSLNEMPDKPNKLVTITASVSGEVVRTLASPADDADWERFTVLVRAPASGEAYAKAFAVVEALKSELPVIVNGSRYHRFIKLNTISYTGRDERSRPMYTVGFKTLRHPDSFQ